LRLKEKGVEIFTSTRAIRFEKEGLWVENPQGATKFTGFAAIVISIGSTQMIIW